MKDFFVLVMSWFCAGVFIIGCGYLFQGTGDLDYLKTEQKQLKSKILNNVAFELDNQIIRCGVVLSNEASVEIMKRGKK